MIELLEENGEPGYHTSSDAEIADNMRLIFKPRKYISVKLTFLTYVITDR